MNWIGLDSMQVLQSVSPGSSSHGGVPSTSLHFAAIFTCPGGFCVLTYRCLNVTVPSYLADSIHQTDSKAKVTALSVLSNFNTTLIVWPTQRSTSGSRLRRRRTFYHYPFRICALADHLLATDEDILVHVQQPINPLRFLHCHHRMNTSTIITRFHPDCVKGLWRR